MATDTFTSSYGELTTTLSPYYSSPSNGKSVLTLIQASNITTTDKSIWVAVSSSAGLFYIGNNIVLPTGASVGLLSGKLILNSTEYIYASASAASSVDLIISAVEQTP